MGSGEGPLGSRWVLPRLGVWGARPPRKGREPVAFVGGSGARRGSANPGIPFESYSWLMGSNVRLLVALLAPTLTQCRSDAEIPQPAADQLVPAGVLGSAEGVGQFIGLCLPEHRAWCIVIRDRRMFGDGPRTTWRLFEAGLGGMPPFGRLDENVHVPSALADRVLALARLIEKRHELGEDLVRVAGRVGLLEEIERVVVKNPALLPQSEAGIGR